MATKRRVVSSEGRSMIARVYHFLREEYEFTDAFKEPNCDLSHLRGITRRTAEATGVSTKTVKRILKKQKELPSVSPKFTSPMKKRKKRDNKSVTIPIQYIKRESSEKDSLSSNGTTSDGEEPQHEAAQSPRRTDTQTDISLRQTIRNIAAQLNDLNEKDSFDAFGRYVASVMRSLPLPRAMAVQPRIVNLLVQTATGSDAPRS